MRTATVERKTNETDIRVLVTLDGTGQGSISTGVGFFDHMLQQLARHGRFDLDITCQGDTHIDDHHTVEDVGIVLGEAVRRALGDRAGIARYGHSFAPMDESLVLCALDISGRGFCACDLAFTSEAIGRFATELVPEFFRAFAHNAGITLHVRSVAGWNAHHMAEAAFKALALALRDATRITDPSGDVPSTKGVL
ncbi:MAG: imidazoleglycerol-phosphate dehydratase HisB [Chthonomonadales bacterium]|nr:imidazoleglycerol-phosphate dehydratase HisB [Chthonomonadales bacterium]